MDSELVSNPYRPLPADFGLLPFVGRKAALARLNQQVNDPTPGAILYVGRHGVGKTALLRRFNSAFDETFVGVFVAPGDVALDGERDLLLALAQATTAEIAHRDFTLGRLADLKLSDDDPRTWFAARFLPEVFTIIRPHRRLFYLLDDADYVLDAIDSNRLAEDTFAYLKGLLERYEQLGMALAMSEEREADVPRLHPLVEMTDVVRLTNFDAWETAALVREPVKGIYDVPGEAVAPVYRATGGVPSLVRWYGDTLFRRWELHPKRTSLSPDDVKAVTPMVYAQAEDEFRQLWAELSLNERLILTAISSLVYADPLKPINTAALENWLVETDYPMDATAINAALRGLEYRELVSYKPQGLTINAGLFQTWLLENALLPGAAARPLSLGAPNRRALWLALGVVLVIVLLVALINLAAPASQQAQSGIQPTVTLVTQP